MKFFDSKIKLSDVKRSKFDLSHEVKLSFNMGELVPILCEEILPGDDFRVRTENMMRLAPMLAPMMHRVNVYTHFIFVPWRLVWNGWEQFITGGTEDGNGALPVPPIFPTLKIGAEVPLGNEFKTGGLLDYMGVPPYDGDIIAPNPLEVNALPFRAYQLIYDEYFRDEDLSAKVINAIDKGDGPVVGGAMVKLLTMRQRAWEKDYFTSARPWAQKGGSVGIPFTYKDASDVVPEAGGSGVFAAGNLGTNGVTNQMLAGMAGATGGTPARIENIEALATINELREASALQMFLEKLARGGSRYKEYLKNIFRSDNRDSRLQRPEWLGGGRSPIVISEVLSTFDNTTGGNPQGTMTGHGIQVGVGHGFQRQFTEHGVVIGLMSVLPRTGYQQGLSKMWARKDQFDFPLPDFAHLGEQAVLNKEVYVDYAEADPAIQEQEFGYQSRYSELKFKNSSAHGDFRNSLAFWHMDRIFATRPALNQQFIESDPTTRIFAIQDPDFDHLWCQVYLNISAIRPLPYHGTPYRV